MDANDPGMMELYILPWIYRLLIAAIIFFVGRWIAKKITAIARRLLEKSQQETILINFLCNILYSVLLVAVIIAAIDQLGVETTSLLAILGAAGLAVGLALKDSLANFSSGVMLILFRPFKEGDFVEAGGQSGIIEQVGVFSTMMRTGDNREIIIPNSMIYGSTITNFSARNTRRIDLVFGIGYDDDLKKAKELINEVLSKEERLLSDPAPAILVVELADSSVNIAVRPWVNSSDYWAVRSDLLENTKAAFDANGISIPFPQRDVHLYDTSKS